MPCSELKKVGILAPSIGSFFTWIQFFSLIIFSIDPDPKPNAIKFKKLQDDILDGNISAMHKIAVSAISLISIFHIDQLPMLMPTYMSLQKSKMAGKNNSNFSATENFNHKLKILQDGVADMDIIKTVAIWAVSCFAKYHPDVVVMMDLVEKD